MAKTKHPEHLNIAILLNSYRSPHITAIRDSYIRSIGAVSPDSKLNFFYPAERDELPDPRNYDLIIIGGSNVNPLKSLPWMLRVHDFIRDVVSIYPEKKICGICWGHQTIARVFGGLVVDMEVPELGVKEVKLTAAGSTFFGVGSGASLRVQQHHRREVSIVPNGFVELADKKQCFLNERNTILTFQGHPEKDAETAKLKLADIIRWHGKDVQQEIVVRAMELEDDGKEICKRVLSWAKEPSRSIRLAPRQFKLEDNLDEFTQQSVKGVKCQVNKYHDGIRKDSLEVPGIIAKSLGAHRNRL